MKIMRLCLSDTVIRDSSFGIRHSAFVISAHADHSSFALAALGTSAANASSMFSTVDLFGGSDFRAMTPSFWQRLLNDDALADCGDLEKIVIGCELIAALDDAELLAAA